MLKSKESNRWRAFAFHLLISVIIACAVVAFIRFVFYPDFYFYLSGGFDLFFLIVSVDIVVGPLLTLVIYKAGKKGLKFDLFVIAFLQVSALIYGISVMWAARPVFNVFVVDRFIVVPASEIVQESFGKAKPEYQKLPWFDGPSLVAAERPASSEERRKILFSSLFSGADIQNYPEYYVPLEKQKDAILEKSLPLAVLREKTKGKEKMVDDFLKKTGKVEGDFRYLPIRGVGFTFMTMLLDLDGVPITVLPIDSEPDISP